MLECIEMVLHVYFIYILVEEDLSLYDMSDVSNENMMKEKLNNPILLMSLIYENGVRSTGMEARGGDADARLRRSSLEINKTSINERNDQGVLASFFDLLKWSIAQIYLLYDTRV